MKLRLFIFGSFLVGIVVFGGLSPIFAQDDSHYSNHVYQYMSNQAASSNQNEKTTGQYPPDFQIDDLVFFDSTYPPGRWNVTGLDHIAIYLGNDSFICTIHNKTTHLGEVNIVSYDVLFNGGILKNPRYARVINATAEQRQAATQWVITRVGDKYQTFDPQKIADPNNSRFTANRWYCSEIIWAAYYHLGIDIDRNGWDRDFPWFFPLWSSVGCDEIYYDKDVVHFL
jgi:cell wall-associated NlpC family hydrolase